MSEEQLPPGPEGSPAQAPPPPPWGESWAAGTAAVPATKQRRPPLALWVVAAFAALLAGFLVFQLVRPSGEADAALALSFKQGDTSTYRLHMTMDGSVDAGTLGSQPVSMDVSETFSWRVKSVADGGIATIEVGVRDLSGTMNGQPMPSTASAGTTTEMRVAPDGRILSAGDLALSASSGSGATGFPGMDQMTPLLPDHPVAPGDTWTKDFSQTFPFGKGDIHYTTSNTFDRYEEVDGSRTAVITSRLTVPLDFSLDFGKLLSAFGGGSASPGTKALKHATIDYGGQGTFVLTSWIDPANGWLVRSSSSGDFDMSMRFSGIPSIPPGSEFSFKGRFTQDLQRA